MALGKGLGAILEEVGQAYEQELAPEKLAEGEGVQVLEIPVEAVEPNPYQPRKEFDETKLRELGESIKRHGLLQPVVVIPNGDRYILIAGERRLRAHRLMELPTIRAVVAEVDLDELRMRELALVENIQREDLNPVELAQAYKELIEVHGITHEELASIVHKSRSQITNTLRLLQLGDYALQKLREQKITPGHAKVLVGLPESRQRVLVDSIIGRKLSVREVEGMIQSFRGGSASAKKASKGWEIPPAEARRIETLLPFPHKIKQKSVEIRIDDEKTLREFIDFLDKRGK
ncbi:ParB/RepB/Spo0J family partition protein [Nitratifractor sp.]